MENNKDYRYKKAKKRVKHLRSFYSSLLGYCIVIPILVYINYSTTSIPWAIFPALGWGIGLVSQWFCITGNHPFFGKDWEERKIKEFMGSSKF